MEITESDLDQPLEIIRDEIAHAREYIEDERERTKGGNSWLNCYRTRVNSIGLALDLAKHGGDVNVEDYQKYKGRLKELASKSKKVQEEVVSGDLPDDKKEELLKQLDIFAETKGEQTPA